MWKEKNVLDEAAVEGSRIEALDGVVDLFLRGDRFLVVELGEAVLEPLGKLVLQIVGLDSDLLEVLVDELRILVLISVLH